MIPMGNKSLQDQHIWKYIKSLCIQLNGYLLFFLTSKDGDLTLSVLLQPYLSSPFEIHVQSGPDGLTPPIFTCRTEYLGFFFFPYLTQHLGSASKGYKV